LSKINYTYDEAGSFLENMGLEKKAILIVFDRKEDIDSIIYTKKPNINNIVKYFKIDKYEVKEAKLLLSAVGLSNLPFEQLFIKWNDNDQRLVKSHNFVEFVNLLKYPNLKIDSRDMGFR